MSYSERHYGAGDPDCPICHGIGYVRYDVPEEHPNFGKAFPCECRRARVEAERTEYLRRIGGLQHLADKTFETFNPEGVGLPERQRHNLRWAYETALAYAREPKGWLVITGGYGCGKTHLAAAVANAQIAVGNRVLFVTVPDLLDYLRASFGPATSEEEGYNDRFSEVREAPLLILDDLGLESPTPWAVEKLYQILNYRYNAKLPTVVTTNCDLDEMEQRFRSRLADPDLVTKVHILAPDYRTVGGSRLETSSLNGLSLYGHMTFETFQQRRDLPKDQRDNLQRALELAREYAANPQGWLILMGPYGCGKTHLAAAIANAQKMQGAEVLFVTVPDLLDHLRAAFAPNSHMPYDRRFAEVKNAQLLVLDDLGTKSATPWAREKLYQLFNYRYNARLPTVITTSEELEDIDPRIATRMRDRRLCRIFAILAPAYLGERQAP